MQKIQGVFTALVTPFTTKGELNEETLRDLIRFQVKTGVQGLVILGTTGEKPTLTLAEREKVIKITREEIATKTHLMVGTGSYSTAETIENTKRAKEWGADSVLVVTPYYNRPTQEGIYLHFKSLVEAVDIPVMIYNIQSRTGQNIQTDTLAQIAQLPYICGVKESSGNISQISEIIEKIGRKFSHFSVMSGDDPLTLPTMALGGDGIISVISNLIPVQVVQMIEAVWAGDDVLAKEIHHALAPLIRMIFIETNPIPLKAAMNLTGFPVGKCRLPLCDLTSENGKKLKQFLGDPAIAKLIDLNQTLYRRHPQLAMAGQDM
jgi:4-hydroxy-tetrahydrodipicolinate synthase